MVEIKLRFLHDYLQPIIWICYVGSLKICYVMLSFFMKIPCRAFAIPLEVKEFNDLFESQLIFILLFRNPFDAV